MAFVRDDIKLVCMYCVHFAVLANVSSELDDRITNLEENGGDDGNSSVAELEVRVEALEGTVVVHDIRITSKNTNTRS